MKKELLYIYHLRASFIKVDERIFEKEYKIVPFIFQITHPFSIPLLWMKQVAFLWKHRKSAAGVVCMFSGYHSFVPALFTRLFNLPLFIISGGIDCVSFPSIRYGNFSKKLLGKITCYSYKKAIGIAPNCEYLVKSYSPFPPVEQEKRQGILEYCNINTDKIKVIYNAMNGEFWRPVSSERTSGSFLCIVYGMDDPVRRILKGVDLIEEAAGRLPDCKFTFVGVIGELENVPENVEILGLQTPEKLRELYSSHQFYLQLSLSEGFGNTIAEAMLCGCVPIGSAAGGIPLIVGDTGFLLEERSVDALCDLINFTSKQDIEQRSGLCRKRILDNFSHQRREMELLRFLKESGF